RAAGSRGVVRRGQQDLRDRRRSCPGDRSATRPARPGLGGSDRRDSAGRESDHQRLRAAGRWVGIENSIRRRAGRVSGRRTHCTPATDVAGSPGGVAMAIWNTCIRRPIFTAMLMLGPVVLGLASYGRLGVERFPNVDVPVVVVTTTLKGASVEEMESSVTKPVEEAVNTVNGIDELRSTTKEGLSTIVIGFKLEKNGEIAAQDLRDKVSTIIPILPVGTDPPKVDKFNLDAAPVVTVVVSGRRSVREVTEIAKKRIKEDLESVAGVGQVVLVGGQQRAVNVTVRPDQLRARRLSAEDVRLALTRQNLELPGGKVNSGGREETLRAMGRVQNWEEFRDVIVADRENRDTHEKSIIRIRDVAEVRDEWEEERGRSRLDGDTAVSLIVQKQSGGNTVAVAEAVKARLKQIQAGLPADIRVEVIRDQSKFIKGSIQEVKFHLLLAALLVSGVIFVFIRDWRTTLIAA